MTPGQFDAAVVRRHLAALDAALQHVRRYAGQSLDVLIADLGGFRNILVHGYLAVDLPRVHALLNTGLDDFVDFAGYVERFIERR